MWFCIYNDAQFYKNQQNTSPYNFQTSFNIQSQWCHNNGFVLVYIQEQLDEATSPWGVTVERVDL